MDQVRYFQRLFDYDAWGNRESLRSLDSAGAGLERALKIFSHIVGAERVWLARLDEHNPPLPAPWPELSLEQCRVAVDEVGAQWRQFIGNLEPDQLDRDIVYRNTKGIEFRTPLVDILQHLVTHSAYHRGQIAATVRQAGGVPVPTDYVVYVRQRAAAGGV